MNRSLHLLKTWPLAAIGLAVACSVSAQSGASPDNAPLDTTLAQAGMTTTNTGQRRAYAPGEGNFSVIPYASHGYVGINVGRPDYDVACVGGFSCSDSTTSYHLYTGGMFNRYLGAELGYVNLGRMDRGGGKTEAHGINLSLVGRVPLGVLHLYGKVGTTYGRTEVTASPLSGLATGKDSGWEGSYGAGIGFDLSPRSAIVVEWNRYQMRFVGAGKQDVDTTSIGYMHRF
jgi:OOP family OmpA-OmpF porin